MTRSLLVPILTVFALAAGVACTSADAENATPTKATAPASAMRVETAVLQPSQASIEIDLPGEIVGSRDANLASALGGYVEYVAVKPGQRIGAGQLVARIDSDLYSAGVAQAEAQLAQAEAEAERLDKMGDLATGQARLNTQTQVKVAAAGLQSAKAQQKRAVVTAPFAGTVADTFIEQGEVAGPGTTVARLVTLDPIKVTLSVPDRDVVALSKGMPVAVTANARAGIFMGEITHIAAAADAKTRSFLVEVDVPNPDRKLLPGMIAHVRAKSVLSEDQLIIPQDWLVTRLDGQGVYVVGAGDKAEWRPLELGSIVRDQVVVDSGVKPGDRLVVNGHRNVVAGDLLLISREGQCCADGRAVWPTE